jgi:hypothetical protein
MDSRTTLEIVGLILGVFALLLAVYHTVEIRTQAEIIRTQADDIRQTANGIRQTVTELDSISNTLPTRHIGQFPEYLEHIVTLVTNAKKSVTVLCDFPAYGSFSAPDTFLAYHQALERHLNLNRVVVALTCLTEPSRLNLIREQFSKQQSNWSDWKFKADSRSKLERFLEHRGRAATVDTLTFESFAEFLEDENVRALQDMFAGAHLQTVESYVPVYFWLVDDKEAVFALPSFDRTTETGFYTRDSALIEGFKDVLSRYHRQTQATT